MKVVEGSWRSLLNGGFLDVRVDRPWLIAMDPFTFRPDSDFDDDGNFYPRDFDQLVPVVQHFIGEGQKSGIPGCFVVFCYSVEKRGSRKPGFYGYDEWPRYTRSFANNFAGVYCEHFEVKRNMYDVGFALATDTTVLKKAQSVWSKLNQS